MDPWNCLLVRIFCEKVDSLLASSAACAIMPSQQYLLATVVPSCASFVVFSFLLSRSPSFFLDCRFYLMWHASWPLCMRFGEKNSCFLTFATLWPPEKGSGTMEARASCSFLETFWKWFRSNILERAIYRHCQFISISLLFPCSFLYQLRQSCFYSPVKQEMQMIPSMWLKISKIFNFGWNISKTIPILRVILLSILIRLTNVVLICFFCLLVSFICRYVIPLDVQVAHYTPAIFPLVPIISPKINQLCCDSWKKIQANKEMTESGTRLFLLVNTPIHPWINDSFFPPSPFVVLLFCKGLELNGITLFYNDFYERLAVMDENKKVWVSSSSCCSYSIVLIAFFLSLPTSDWSSVRFSYHRTEQNCGKGCYHHSYRQLRLVNQQQRWANAVSPLHIGESSC